jgi:hypothetical protein
MTAGFDFPLGLLLFLPLAALLWLCLRREEKNFLVHPWAEHLRLRLGSGTFRSHLLLFFFALAAACAVLVVSRAWYGVKEVRTSERGRMVTFYLDVSSSTDGPTRKAEAEVIRALLQRRKDDQVNIVFFASEALATPFGLTSRYVTDDLVERYSGKLGGSTVAANALFQGFVAIAREEELLSEKELWNLSARLLDPSLSRRAGFLRYLDALIDRKKPAKADRLAIMVSDCMLSYESHDIVSVMKLHEAFGVRHEAICITGSKTDVLSGADHAPFVEGIKSLGGSIRQISEDNKTDFAKALDETVKLIDESKPRDLAVTSTVDKRYIANECFSAALAALICGIGAALIFRVNG